MIEPEDLYNATVDATIAFLGETLKPWDSLTNLQKQKWIEMAHELNLAERTDDNT